LDFIAKRYGKLPSEVLKQGNTIDITASEIAVEYESYWKNKDSGKPMQKQHSQAELEAMVARVKEKKQ
jgi:hypothetical protein